MWVGGWLVPRCVCVGGWLVPRCVCVWVGGWLVPRCVSVCGCLCLSVGVSLWMRLWM